MGFWSSLGSACKSIATTVGSVISSSGKAISRAASAVWEGAKDVASKAVGWLADKAETFVGKVKKVWEVAKPYIKAALPVLEKLAAVSPWPWLATGIKVIRKGLEYLSVIEDKPWFKKAKTALEWSIHAAQKFREMRLNKTEEQEAEQRHEDLQAVMQEMQTEEQRQSIRFAQLINDYVLTQTRIQRIFDENSIQNFEHYLRLRATQKLLKQAESTLEHANKIDDISNDDLFLMEVATELLASKPVLTDEQAIRLDSIINKRIGKSLIPFVFEEMIFTWGVRLDSMKQQWERMSKEVAGIKREVGELKAKNGIEDLTHDEQNRLAELSGHVLTQVQRMKQQEQENRAMENYINAAEGFLQTLEKDESYWINEDKEYVLEEVNDVGMIIIDCAEHNKPWDDLTSEEQSLIVDYANIFAKDALARKQKIENLIEVGVA